MPSYWFFSLRFCWVLLSLLPSTAAAQLIVGNIVNSATQQPIPFVNVGLPKRGLGTVSDEQGHYQLRYNPAYAADSVRVSSVGYEPRMLPFAALLAGANVGLAPLTVSLTEVSVVASSAYSRTHTLGLDKPGPKFDFRMMSNELVVEKP